MTTTREISQKSAVVEENPFATLLRIAGGY